MIRLIAMALLLALSACAVPPAPPPGPPAPAAVLTPQAPMVFPDPPPAAPPAEIVVVPPPAQPLPPPPPPTLNPTDLMGKPRGDVVALLGGPDQARTEADAEVFLYQGEGCVLYVFLYEPQGGGAHRVEHVELGPRARDVSRDPACLTGLLLRAAAG